MIYSECEAACPLSLTQPSTIFQQGRQLLGHVQIVMDNVIVLDQDIRWTSSDSKRMIDQLTLHNL